SSAFLQVQMADTRVGHYITKEDWRQELTSPTGCSPAQTAHRPGGLCQGMLGRNVKVEQTPL
ncbi:MAG: hypothetical protein PHQ40_07770, partial [Anaerolineaceae bacterium]|nr:hypothetical protein [Anaerolineaceae bacterium]